MNILMFTERLELLSKEIEAFKDEINTLNERVNNASKMINELKEKAKVLVNKSNEVKAYIDSGEVPNKFIAEFKKATEPQDGLMDFEYCKALKLAEEETQE